MRVLVHSVSEFSRNTNFILTHIPVTPMYVQIPSGVGHHQIRVWRYSARGLRNAWGGGQNRRRKVRTVHNIYIKCSSHYNTNNDPLRTSRHYIRYCRESKKPYLGICLGMQVMVIEYVRSILGRKGANSEEFDKNCSDKAVVFMPEIDATNMGGTMRLGARPTIITPTLPDGEKSLAARVYVRLTCSQYHDYSASITIILTSLFNFILLH